jgi:hypothetical protein
MKPFLIIAASVLVSACATRPPKDYSEVADLVLLPIIYRCMPSAPTEVELNITTTLHASGAVVSVEVDPKSEASDCVTQHVSHASFPPPPLQSGEKYYTHVTAVSVRTTRIPRSELEKAKPLVILPPPRDPPKGVEKDEH